MYSSLYSIKCNKEYVDEYVAFIESCRGKELPKYVEKHHILPRSLFPEFAKVKANIIKLSAADHFRAHMILAKAFGGPMWVAANRLTQNQYGDRVITAEEYELIRANLSSAISENLLKQWSTGKRSKEAMSKTMLRCWAENKEARTNAIREAVDEDFRQKSGKGAKESWGNPEQREQRLASMAKAMSTDEYKAKHSKNQSERMKDPTLRNLCGWSRGMKFDRQPQHTCPHCNKIGRGGAMKRYHFDNCKSKSA